MTIDDYRTTVDILLRRPLVALSASVLLARPDRLERLLEVPVMAFQIVGLVAAVTVEGVLDLHRDRGALGEGVLVVRVDAVTATLIMTVAWPTSPGL